MGRGHQAGTNREHEAVRYSCGHGGDRDPLLLSLGINYYCVEELLVPKSPHNKDALIHLARILE